MCCSQKFFLFEPRHPDICTSEKSTRDKNIVLLLSSLKLSCFMFLSEKIVHKMLLKQ